MEQAGIVKGRVVLVDPASVGVPLTAMVLIKTSAHDANWLKQFQATLHAYDAFYKRLTSRISVSDISASFVMEEIKETTAVPL